MTASSTAPNLLTLPRELRDHIYGYLVHTIGVEWDGFGKDAVQSVGGSEQVIEPLPGRLMNCPYPHVLRIHPLICEEYHGVCAKKLEVVFDQSLHMRRPLESRYNPLRALQDQVLSHLRHVKIFVRLHARTMSQNLDWRNQLHILRDVAVKAPQLETLRVAVRQQCLSNAPTCQDFEVPAILTSATERLQNASTKPFLPEMPASLGELCLVQRGEGYHLGYASTYRARDQPLHPDLSSTYTIDGQEHVMYHGIRKIGVYTFASKDINYEKRLWTRKELISRWPMRKYPKEAIENVASERAALLLKFPLEHTEWIERRGVHDVQNWS
ncbi:hypothetical protein HBI54_182850 [Parastagonospora nodorum]|nr:hypothetical protein HBI54_182850 [Parastagonospora nodorum]